MKNRYHLWIAAALVLGGASTAQARDWKGSTGVTYETLNECQKKTPPCTPVGRMVQVGDVSEIPVRRAELSRLARGGRPVPVIYYMIVTGPRWPASQGATDRRTTTCHNESNGTYHSPPCAKHEIKMVILEDF